MSWNIKTPGDYINGPLTIVGDVTVKTSLFKVDTTNNRIGFGTANPAALVDVNGSKDATNMIIGAPLSTVGGVSFVNYSELLFKNTAGGNSDASIRAYGNVWNAGGSQLAFFTSNNGALTERFRLYNNGVATWSNVDGVAGIAMTLNSNGLGIGGSPSYKLDVVGDGRVIGDTYIFKNQAGAVESKRLIFGSAANSSAAAISSLTATANDGYLSLFTKKAGTLTEQVWIDSNGNTTVSYGNLVMGTAGKGIDFSSGSNAAGMTSEILNDYEEGNWTPVVADAATGGNTGTCTINSAKYVKIGRQVSIQCDISGITTTGMTAGNVFFIRGLPFTSVQGGDGNFYTYRVGRDAATASSSVHVSDASSVMIFSLYTTNSATADKTLIVSNIVSTTSQIILSVTYFV